MRLCARIILRIIGQIPHNPTIPHNLSHLWMTFCYTSGILLTVTNVRYILTMRQCKKLSRRSFVAIVERRSHCFSPIEELSATECQRLASAAVTDTAEMESGWQVSCVTANSTYTVSSQWLQGRRWSSRSAEMWSHGFKINTVCVATWVTQCSSTNVDWTSGDPQGWRCSSQDGQVRKQ